MILWRCTVCGFIHDGENPPEKCPKCGAPAEKFEKLPEEKVSLVERSRYSNLLHARLLVLADEMTAVAEKGIQDNLDPGCLDVFKKAKAAAHTIGQMVKAEIQSHMNKGKWG